jgi:nickel-dependent lactate racemase
MKFIVDVTAFDRTETVEVDARDVGEALREACENTNISVKVREIDDPQWAHVDGFKSIP